jgi:hypothetical protein
MTPQDDALICRGIDGLRTLRQTEEFLCALGMSQWQATTFVQRVVKSTADPEIEFLNALRQRGDAHISVPPGWPRG